MAKKSILKIATAIVSAVLTATSLCSCENLSFFKEENSNAKLIKTEVLNDFSNEKDMYQVILTDGYGKMTLNKDEEYCSTGGGSAKLWVSNENGKPMGFKQRLTSLTQGYDYSNFKNIKNVKTAIYNASTEEVKVLFAIEFSDGSKSAGMRYTLQSGWNYLTYAVDRELLSLQFDLEKAMYLSYSFSCNPTPYTVYVDSISLSTTSSEIKEVVQQIDENEICSFDKNYQVGVFSLYVYSPIRMAYFSDFGLTSNPDRVKSGKAFYVTTLAGLEDKGNWNWLRLNEKYGEKIDWSSLTEEDAISFWVFNEGPACSLSIGIPITKMKSGWLSVQAVTMKSYEWTEVVVPVAKIKEVADKQKKLEEGEKIGDIIKGISIGWAAFDDVEQKTFYFDEFKIVKGGAN